MHSAVSPRRSPPRGESSSRQFVRAACLGIENDLFCRSFLLYYPRFLSPKRLLKYIRYELEASITASQAGGVIAGGGAARLLRRWLEERYVIDFSDRRLLRSCSTLLIRAGRKLQQRGEDNSGLLIELNRAKLVLLRKNATAAKEALIASKRLQEASSPSVMRAGGTKLMQNPAKMLADCLTCIEHSLFAALPLSELCGKSAKSSGSLAALVERTNRISRWAASNILVQKNASIQAQLVTKFIDVAYMCYQRGNFATAIAIMQTFNLGYVGRLRQTWNLSKHVRILGQQLDPLVSPRDNYKAYRDAIRARREAGETCIPFLPVHQKDLTIAEEANQDRLPDRAVNVEKMLLVGKILEELKCFQHQPILSSELARYEASPNTSNVLKQLQLLPSRKDSALEALSEQIRPRVRTDDESTASQGSGFFNLETSISDSNDSISEGELIEV